MALKWEDKLFLVKIILFEKKQKFVFNYFNILITPKVPGGAEITPTVAEKPDIKINQGSNVGLSNNLLHGLG